ncbi:MAG: hydroxyacid dehydrogenase [Thaumarchaeota archaeon]|nr:hydroxyacid dehydrogenase [Nitrososphaerota archaeon]
MPHKVLVCDTVDVASLGLPPDFEVDYFPKITPEELLERVQNYDAVVVRSRTKVTAEVIARATKLKLIARPGTGLDNVDLRAANSRGIEVVNSPEALVEAVAEHVLGLMLAMARNIPAADSSTRSGEWQKDRFVGVELRGRTLGIAGLGRIGRRVGELAKAFGMPVLGYDVVEISKDVLASIGCTMVDLDTLFASSDFVTLHVPLSPETTHLVDSRRLASMRRSAYLVNASRGEVIDETALIAALRDGTIAGAGLDVFETEPPSREMLAAPNLIATPHIAGQTKDAQKMAITITGKKIAGFFEPK